MKKVWKIAAGLLLCLVLLILAAGGWLFFARQPLMTELPDNGGADWMAGIQDGTPLCMMSLPGTHDSCTWNSDFSYFSQCQNSEINTQLAMGIRYLDIRVSPDRKKEELKMTHGVAVCREGGNPFGSVLTLSQVLEDCYEFLDNHPTETIVFCVKPEGDSAECEVLFRQYLEKRPDMWYVENSMPELGQVRGRLVLAERFKGEPEGMGLALHWAEQDNREILEDPFSTDSYSGGGLLVQDRYCYELEPKWEAIRYGIYGKPQEADMEKDIVLQFLSTKGSASLGHPYRYASVINARFQEEQLPQSLLGWVIMDFAEPELVRSIFETNPGLH